MIKEASKVISIKYILSAFLFLVLIAIPAKKTIAQSTAADRICGKWISEEKNCIVQVSKMGAEFVAKLVWFNDADDKTQPMESRVDYKNPNPALRTRKLLGMEVLDNLTYNPHTNSWENGMIYDAKSGHTWSSAASLVSNNILKVTGYWHFKFLGKTMTFNRVQ
jgi:uncharacterized protein (DUF2147 family)